MTTLKDLIHDVIVEYHRDDSDTANDPQLLEEAIMDTIGDFLKKTIEL